MVFVKRDIPASQALVVWEATDIPKDKLLQVTNQINMAGMMTQFTLLMTYSHEVFEGLLDEANATFDRLKDMGARVADLQATLPDIEATFDGEDMATLQRMNATAATRYLAANPEKQDHFQPTSMPKPVRAVREKCFPPPSLHLLDPFRSEDDRTPTLTKYSNPLFFLQQWAAEQQAKTDELRAERKKKRAERVARRAERDAQQQGAKPVRKLRKIRYDPQTGQRIVEEEDDTAPMTARGTPPVQPHQQHQQPANQAPVTQQQPPSPTVPAATTPGLPAALPPPAAEPTHTSPPVHEKKSKKDKTGTGKKDKKEKRPKEDAPLPPSIPAVEAPSYLPAPVPPTPNVPAPIAPSIPPPFEAVSIPAPIGGGPAAPPPPPPPAAGPPPPPPPAGGPAPPPPPPPSSGGGGTDTSDLLAAIRGGSNLKKAVADGGGGGSIEKPVDTRSNLMENIRAGLKLKSAGERKIVEVKQTESAPSSVAEILARRIAIEPDSDDDVDDDNDDWSD